MLNSIERQKQDLIQDEFGLGLALGYCRRLKFTENNTPIIVAYLKALGNEIHLSDNYKRILQRRPLNTFVQSQKILTHI